MSDIRHNVRFADYLAWPMTSQTTLKAMGKSPAHYRAVMTGERQTTPTDAMVLGSALHAAFLEPERLADTVVCWGGKTRRGGEWDQFRAEHAGKYILTGGYYETMCGMVESLRCHPFVREWSERMDGVEVAATGLVHGLQMKGRVDALTDDPLVDLKKCAAADERTVTDTIMRFGYHIQAAIYRELFDRERFVLLFVESTPPHYDVVPFEFTPEFLRLGEETAKELIGKVIACERSGQWPGRWPDRVPCMLEPPEWAVPELEADYANVVDEDAVEF